MVTAVVLTKNEEKNIKRCLQSLLWCQEIIIVDDYSTDNTIKIIKKTGKKIKIYKRHLQNDFSSQRNFALTKAKGDWVLFVDADEVVAKDLQNEIIKTLNKKTKYNAFYLKRLDNFLGRELHFGEAGNTKLIRLAKKDSGHWKRSVHEYWHIKGDVGDLKNSILHYPHPTITELVSDINFYSDMHARELIKEKKNVNIVKIIFWPVGKFFVNYFLKLGFLDGVTGFIMSVMMSFHSFLSWSKAWTH